MKGLNQFVKFDWDAFAKGKIFLVTGIGENVDFETKQHLGTKLDCVISEDKTAYNYKNGEQFTNRYEHITFKVDQDINVPLEARVIPKGVTATIYGEYRNQISVRCKDIEIPKAHSSTELDKLI